MLGIASHAQRAGWGTVALREISFASSSAMTKTLYASAQTPQINNFGKNINTPNQGNTYNVANLTSQSGYNTLRYQQIVTFYLEWPAGLSQGGYGGITALEISTNDGQGTLYANFELIVTASGQFGIGGGYDNFQTVVLPGAYTNWTNRWLTFVVTGAETASVYTNWTGTGTGANYNRMALYDSETAVLLNKTDWRDTARRASLASLGTVYDGSSYGSQYVSWASFGSGTPEAGFRTFRLASAWWTLGQMFDPLSATDLSWLTAYPSQTIAGIQPWYNLTFDNFDSTSGDSTYGFFLGNNGARYSAANGMNANWTSDPTEYASLSTTIIPKDKS